MGRGGTQTDQGLHCSPHPDFALDGSSCCRSKCLRVPSKCHSKVTQGTGPGFDPPAPAAPERWQTRPIFGEGHLPVSTQAASAALDKEAGWVSLSPSSKMGARGCTWAGPSL